MRKLVTLFIVMMIACSAYAFDATTRPTMYGTSYDGLPYVQFEIDGQTCQEGRLVWNDDDKTMTVCTENADVSLQVGQEMYVRGTNKTDAILLNGQAVYIDGAQGNRPTFALANAVTETTSARVVGLVTADIPINGTGYVTTFGLVRGLNTSSFSEGDVLWLSTTPGGLTNSIPATPSHATFIGTCVTSDATAGVINVRPYNGFELYEIHDVLITSASDGDVLVYNGTYWENKSPAYGQLYYHSHVATLDFATTTAFINVTGLTENASMGTTLSGANGTITVSQAGEYKANASASFTSAGVEVYHLYVGVNGADKDQCAANRQISTPTDVGSIGADCLVSLAAGDIITFMVNSAASDTIQIESLNLNIELIR